MYGMFRINERGSLNGIGVFEGVEAVSWMQSSLGCSRTSTGNPLAYDCGRFLRL